MWRSSCTMNFPQRPSSVQLSLDYIPKWKNEIKGGGHKDSSSMEIFIVALREKTGREESPGWTWRSDTTRPWEERGRAREELPIKTPAEMPRDWHSQNGCRKGSLFPGSEWFPVGGGMRGIRRSQWYWGMLGGLASIGFDMLIDTSVSHLFPIFET